MEHEEVVLHPKVFNEVDELARIFHYSAREAMEEHVASEAIRRAAATRSWPMKTFEPGTFLLFFSPTPPRQTSGHSNARTVSGTRGFGWTSPSDLCAPLNTCQESHWKKRIVWASMEEDRWMSCSRRPERYQKTTRI